jgi:hypothetical protein
MLVVGVRVNVVLVLTVLVLVLMLMLMLVLPHVLLHVIIKVGGELFCSNKTFRQYLKALYLCDTPS